MFSDKKLVKKLENPLKSLNEECGVMGTINNHEASYDIYLGLHSLQHRGQESGGVTTFYKNKPLTIKKSGPIVSSFTEKDIEYLKGDIAIGHCRYSTFGGTDVCNMQPFAFENKKVNAFYASCHNGNLTNAITLKNELLNKNITFTSNSDSEILGHLINLSEHTNPVDKLKEALNQLKGAYSFILIKENKLYGCRDPFGFRPLVLGFKLNPLNNSKIFYLASETVALDIVGASFVRDIEPGEIIEIDMQGNINSFQFASKKANAMCSMEYIYFSRPDSLLEGDNVHLKRKEIGKQLAKEHFMNADVVIGVPDSSLSAAMGYAEQSKIPFEMGLVKNKYIARSFIAPTQKEREKILLMKLNANEAIIKNKKVILIDDSIVRGSTMKAIIKIIKNAGAKEIHIRIGAPEMKWPCFYGVDTSNKKELVMAWKTKEEYLKELKYADSLEFLSLDNLQKALNRKISDKTLCAACFSNQYFEDLVDYQDKK